MIGAGEYGPDVTEGIRGVEDLPQPKVVRRSRNYPSRTCPRCGQRAGRRGLARRPLHDLGDVLAGRPVDLVITYSKHKCPHCHLRFTADMTDLALPKCLYSKRVQHLAVRLVAEDGLPYRSASWHLWRDHRVFVPYATIQNWVEAAGEKSLSTLQTTYLDEALAGFSGYLAIDEVYDGPFCILSVVDNRAFRRLAFRVLEHDPDQDDMRSFWADFKAHLEARALEVRGITTDGSSLYPTVLKELWPEAPHQICVFHVLKEITKAVLHALAKLRKELAKHVPKRPRGRPRQDRESRATTRQAQRLQEKVAELFEHRYLFVRHRLTKAEQKVLARLVRGRPHLRALREIMDEVYRLFDRRCRTATAWQRLAKLRARVRWCKRLGKALDKLQSPTLDKALLFLDDDLLGATSNAVERGNRRFRKAQRSIYSELVK